MALTDFERDQLLKNAGPKMAELAERLSIASDKDTRLKAPGDKFSAAARNDIMWHKGEKLAAMEAQLNADPKLAGQIETALESNPQGFSNIVSDLFKDPSSAKRLMASITAAPAPTPAMAPKAPSSPAADPQKSGIIETVVNTAIPSAQAATGSGPDHKTPVAKSAATKATQATVGTAAVKMANPDADAVTARKMDELEKVPGFADLMNRVQKNPALSDLFKRLTSGSGESKNAALDQVLDQTKKDPNMFKNLSKTIDEQPGAVSSIASAFSNSPEMALGGITMLSNFAQSDFGKNGFGKMLIGLIGPLVEKIGGFLKGSDSIMTMGSSALTVMGLKGIGANPSTVAAVDSSGQVNTKTGKEFVDSAGKTGQEQDQKGRGQVVPAAPAQA